MNTIFVYGTLKPGHNNWRHLTPYATTARKTFTQGTLYDTGCGWPAATFGDTGTVPGWTVDIPEEAMPDALLLLDLIEGVQRGLFERIIITDNLGRQCWAYQWPTGVEDFTPIDEW